MTDVIDGFITAITGMIGGFMAEIILKAFIDAGSIPSSMAFMLQLISIPTLIAFIHVTRYWGTLYLLGWWFGSGIMFYSGLFGFLEFAFYSAILLIVLFSRIKRGFD